MDPGSSHSASDSHRREPPSTWYTSMSSGRRGESSVMTTASTGSLIDTTDTYRMGIPGELRPLPLQHHPIPAGHPIIPLWESTLRPSVLAQLESYGIQWLSVSMYPRTFRNRLPKDEDLTIYIVANRDESDQWVLFLDTVSEFLSSIGYDSLLVEIVDPRATRGRLTFPIRYDDQILRDWEGIRPLLLQAISQGLEWTSLQAYRRGYDKFGDDSIQTIVVCCEDYFSNNWKDAALKINPILNNLEYEVRFELWQGRVSRGAHTASLDASAFTRDVIMGNGIGHEDSAGTLGGYINLTNSQGRAKVLGLTNYHVIRTPAMKTSCDNDGTGNARGSDCAVKVFSPSLIDIEASVREKNDLIKSMEETSKFIRLGAEMGDDRYIRRLQDRERLIAEQTKERKLMEDFNPYYGEVHSFSGFRKTIDDFVLDWALIDVEDDRIGGNFFPPGGAQEVRKTYRDANWVEEREDFKQISTISLDLGLPDNERQVFKWGRTTSIRWGILHRIRPDVRFTDGGIQRTYRVWEVMPATDKAFAMTGDSGSLVIDNKSNILGLLMGTGEQVIGGMLTPVGYLTPIDVVFDDIQKITGCKVSVYTAQVPTPIRD